MEFKLGRPTLLLWRIRTAVISAVFVLLFALFSGYTLFMLIPIAFAMGIFLLANFWYLPKLFGNYTINVTDNAIIIKKGVFFKVCHIMPFKRMVFAKSFSTPLAGMLGLKAVTLRAARAALIIPEMSANEANRLIYGLNGGGNRHE